MTIPDYQTLMLPLLKNISDGMEHKTKEVVNSLSNEYHLTEEEKRELLPSGQQPIIDNRIGWARTYLLKAGLLSSPRRGYIKITEKGLEVLKQKPNRVDIKFLEKFPEFIEFRTIKKETSKETVKDKEEVEDVTPDELMEKGYNSINASLTQELLEKLRNIDPYFFEDVVGELLTVMGYGRFEATPGSGDEGIDGIVYQDKLGLDKIFFQAKRYGEGNSVSARDVRDFVGTLDLHGVSKGIFITTSRFPKDTSDILKKTPKNIILIDGPKLAKLMIEHDVGVSTQKTYKIKKIDTDFFPEE
ncbi:restriction endonuclease [Candidatus Woesearchaeota archaeon CG10_big_fil_rev_8_21_14_0_10_44_13]|nr:MAG: restriction endonuclease [Candidatus Woesearchaeota archaeon CG10_big_fil_rev_8_21_14_0_10_44_13]